MLFENDFWFVFTVLCSSIDSKKSDPRNVINAQSMAPIQETLERPKRAASKSVEQRIETSAQKLEKVHIFTKLNFVTFCLCSAQNTTDEVVLAGTRVYQADLTLRNHARRVLKYYFLVFEEAKLGWLGELFK